MALEAAISSIHLIEKALWEDSGMAKVQKKAKERVVSIDAYRQSRTKDVGRLTSQILVGRWYADFSLEGLEHVTGATQDRDIAN